MAHAILSSVLQETTLVIFIGAILETSSVTVSSSIYYVVLGVTKYYKLKIDRQPGRIRKISHELRFSDQKYFTLVGTLYISFIRDYMIKRTILG